MKGPSFTVTANLAKDSLAVPAHTLVDTGASGYIFIDLTMALNFCKTLGAGVHRLEHPLVPSTFEGKEGKSITHWMKLNLWISGRRFAQVPMMITNLGTHDLIIGKNWLAEHDIWLDAKNRRLIWPEDRSPVEEVQAAHQTVIPKQILKRPTVDPKHQADADRRDSALERADARKKAHTLRTEAIDRRDDLSKMQRSLDEALQAPPPVQKPSRVCQIAQLVKAKGVKPSQINIALVGAPAFARNAQKSGEAFEVSLHEIDRSIEDRLTERFPEEVAELRTRLPACYQAYADVFSKQASDELPPHRDGVDMEVKLEEGASVQETVRYSPLIRQSLEELLAMKKYLSENLHKGFIVPTDAPYASPVLMARKPGGGLRFCVDFRKLNSITQKDRYPIPLIDELMERVNGARIFTKIDIR